MKRSTLIINSAISSLLALGVLSANVQQAQAADENKDKCYGVAAKGQNDCGTAEHTCAGQAKADNLAHEWKYVAKGTCEQMGGQLATGDMKKDEQKKDKM